MGKINMQKVLVGGLIAGVVLNVVDSVLFGVVLRDQMAAAMTSINRPAMTNSQIPWFVFLDFVAEHFKDAGETAQECLASRRIQAAVK